jgi:hypothetical protein
MENNSLIESEVIKKLINLNNDLAGKGSCVAWTTFSYNKNNLKVVKNSLRRIKWKEEDYSLNYDENLIFVEKDLI